MRENLQKILVLNTYGPISSIPVSWAINVVPHINVQINALTIEDVF